MGDTASMKADNCAVIRFQDLHRRLGLSPFLLELNIALLAYDEADTAAFAPVPASELWFSDKEIASNLLLSVYGLRSWLSPLVSKRSILKTLEIESMPRTSYRYLPAEVKKFLKVRFEEPELSFPLFGWFDFLDKLLLTENEVLDLTYLTAKQLRSIPRFFKVSKGVAPRSPRILDQTESWYRYSQLMRCFHPSYDGRKPITRRNSVKGQPRYISWKDVIAYNWRHHG